MKITKLHQIEAEAKEMANEEIKRLMAIIGIELDKYKQQLFISGYSAGVLELSSRIARELLKEM